jgi:hypothetical protein
MHRSYDNRPTSVDDGQLVRRFVATFQRLDELMCLPQQPPMRELFAGTNGDGRHMWRPVEIPTSRDELEHLYRRLPGRFPALYERLVLTHRWMEVDLQTVRLLANPPGATLSGLIDGIFSTPQFAGVLIPAGFVPFGKSTNLNFDPICFDLNSMKGDDCPIVEFDHEPLLCHDKIGASRRRSTSFRNLMYETIELATSRDDRSTD